MSIGDASVATPVQGSETCPCNQRLAMPMVRNITLSASKSILLYVGLVFLSVRWTNAFLTCAAKLSGKRLHRSDMLIRPARAMAYRGSSNCSRDRCHAQTCADQHVHVQVFSVPASQGIVQDGRYAPCRGRCLHAGQHVVFQQVSLSCIISLGSPPLFQLFSVLPNCLD